MKTINLRKTLKAARCMVIAFTAMSVAGCSSVGFKTGDKTAQSLQRASESVQYETQALNATIASLANLVNSPEPDLKPQFKEFSASLDRLDTSVSKADKAIARLQRDSAAYFEAWNSELGAMNYEVIRNSSEARMISVSNQLAAVCQRYEEAQAVVRPFISYFTDIQRSLGTDLTMDGLTSARDVVRNAESNTQKVKMALEQLGGEMASSSARLSSEISANPPLAATGQSSTATGPQREAGLH